MENESIKTLTVIVIIAFLYLWWKGRNAAVIPNTSPAPCVPPNRVIPQPMESSTCAIPLAADYLCCGPHVAAVSNIVKRNPIIYTHIPQAMNSSILSNTSFPYPARGCQQYQQFKQSVACGGKFASQIARLQKLARAEGICVNYSCCLNACNIQETNLM